MSNINSLIGIVKILEPPKTYKIGKDILITKVRAQFPQVRKNSIVHLKFWGKLANDIKKYYTVNDYILIEGYVSARNSRKNDFSNNTKVLKKVEITVLKVYPFFLNYNFSQSLNSNR